MLASAHATDKKSVDLSFLGKGSRRVRVGYIQETPIWKTTYRLVLSDEKPFLQGWAIVENTSEEDWSGVNLTLVSGRPISFTMDLYQPLYIPRPEEQLELYASLRPQTYGQDLARERREFAERLAADAAASARARRCRWPPQRGSAATADGCRPARDALDVEAGRASYVGRRRKNRSSAGAPARRAIGRPSRQRGQPLPIRDRHAREPAPPAVGHAADRQRAR